MTVCGEKVTGVCVAGKCPYFKRCHPVVWDKYGKIKPKTNEEWLKSHNTKLLAEWIAHQTMIALLENQNNHSLRMTYPAYWVEWLKQPHQSVTNCNE